MSKKILSAFLALVMVLAIGAIPAFAAENIAPASNARATYLYSGSNWSFRHQRDTDQFYVAAGTTINLVLNEINSTGSQSFTVKLCKYVNGSAQVVSGPLTVGSNASNRTITMSAPNAGYYFFRCERTNDGIYQNIGAVYVITA